MTQESSLRVLVTGAAGQLGSDLVPFCRALGDDVIAFDRSRFDLSEPGHRQHVVAARPDVVINCAAFTAVDRCESERVLAHEVNEHGTRRLARACADAGAHLIHVSTDYVFDGTLDRPYREDDTTNPLSVYGQSKLAGELAATEVLGDDVTIVRTSWVCGQYGSNMVSLVLRLGAGDGAMAFVEDQRGCPTFTTDLSRALRQLAGERPGGVYHLTNQGAVSWFEFVQEIMATAGHDPARVRPIATSELEPPRPAPRPTNSVLENARWLAEGHEPLRDFRQPLAELVALLSSP